ncbi:MAG TPA: ABC transporter ATP-binding protein, partial [Tepidisphaeraceae bacterium]|nr:ABC transporter ATP-binding protein [Tepidisphaeraceae bacterium]
MSSEQSKKGRTRDFLRALTYLWPHRRLVTISIICAFVVGLAFTTGLSTMLPILQVFFNGDTVQAWTDRQVAGARLGAKLLDDPHQVAIVKVHYDRPSPAAAAGIKPVAVVEGVDELHLPPLPPQTYNIDKKILLAHTSAIVHYLADPHHTQAALKVADQGDINVHLLPAPFYFEWMERTAVMLPKSPVGSIAAVFGILASLALFGNFIRFFQEYLAEKAAILAVNDVRRQLYDHVLHMPLSYFSSKGTSDATSRLVQDANGLLQGFKAVLGDAIQEPIKAAMAFGLALIFSWKLTIFIALFAPIMAVLIHKFGRKMRRANRRALERSAVALSQLEGTLIGVRVVKASTAERLERRRYTQILWQLVKQNLRMARIDAASAPILESLTLLLAGVIILYAAYLVFNAPEANRLNPTHFMLVMGCLVSMGDSLRKITKVNNSLQKANAAAGRIFEMLAISVERRRGALHSRTATRQGLDEQSIRLPAIQREICFEDVCFTYPDSPYAALTNVNLSVARGTSVAIVGRNGSGKTTLLALLPRFYDPTAGRITIDGIDIRQATLKSLRGQIGIVTQDSVVFPGTIEQNIAYGFAKPDRQRVIDSARRAFANEFIEEKGGYETQLGEHGLQLSGGQKQR